MSALKRHACATLLHPALLMLSEQYSSLFESQPIIWPATAGLLVIALAFGRRYLIGPMLAGFMLTTLEYPLGSSSVGFGMPVAQALLFSSADLLRTLLVLWLINRWCTPLSETLHARTRLILFMVLIGPINGSLNTLTTPLFIDANAYASEDLLMLYARWWLATTAGGLIFLPSLLLLLSPRLMPSHARRWFLWSSLFAIALLYAIVMFIRIQVDDELEQLDQRTSDRLAESLRTTFDEIADLNNSMRSLLTTLPQIEDAFFLTLAADLQGYDSPFVSYVSWSDWVPLNNLANYERDQQCQIQALPTDEGFSDQEPNSVHVPIRLIYPTNITPRVRCLDLASETERRRALFIAIQTGQSILSNPIELAADQGPGLLMFTPAYDEQADPIGLVTSVIVIETLIRNGIAANNLEDSWFQIQQLDGQSEYTLYQQTPEQQMGLTDYARSLNLSLYGQSWRIHWRPVLAEFSRIFAWQVTLVITLASVAVLLIQFIAFRTGTLNQRIREEVELKTIDLSRAQQAAEDASVAKSQFLANMSHEIRTPLNAIIGFAELASDEKNVQTIQSHLKGISSSSEALLSLINDVLDYSKLEAGKLDLHKAPFSLHELAKRVRSIFEPQARARGLSFTIDVETPAHRDLVSDETRLLQILMNLCSNAIKFTSAGSVAVHLKTEDQSDTPALLLMVEDTGIGICESEQATIFDQFTQADASISRHYGGTGLGLSITMTLTELLGGHLSVQSERGKGSCFSVHLPVSLVDARQAPVHHWRVNEDYYILVVDDNAVNLKVTQALLQKSGFQVGVASSGEHALSSIQSSTPDLVLMDIQMPGMDGLETTRALRRQPDFNQLIIIGLTANVSQDDRQACLDAGMNDYLTKPISMHKLSECLSRWLPS